MKKGFQWMALLVVAMLGACSGGSDKAAAEKVDEKPRVKLAEVSSRPVEQIQEYTATVEAEVKNNIAPSSPVRIDRIFVEVGDRVSKGQKLVSMDAANLKQIKYQLDNQQIEFKRIDELYKVGGASKSEWDAAKMNLDIRETSYKNLLENTSLLSPINGVVTARNYDNGDMYSGGEPVLVVEQITPVKLYINVSEGYFTKVKKGAPVSVKVDVYGDEEFEGKISLVYPTIDYITLCRERGQAVLHSVVTAGRSRLRPVLMTTLTTILGMVPMAVGQGEGAEMWRPLGVAVIGGLTVSTILTLILVPVLYCSFAGIGIRRTRKKIKKDRELNDYYQLHKEKMTKPRKQ